MTSIPRDASSSATAFDATGPKTSSGRSSGVTIFTSISKPRSTARRCDSIASS